MMANVKDFGAVGDGVTDDSAAFQRAMQAGDGELYLPPGPYRVRGPGASGFIHGIRVAEAPEQKAPSEGA
jgi:polygalacturonase